MKQIILALFIFTMSVSGTAQINVGVVIPDDATGGITLSSFKSLGHNLERSLSEHGFTIVNGGNIVLFPVVTILKDELIEGGMKNVYNAEVGLTAKLVSLNGNITFGSISCVLKGYGKSRTQALENAFNKGNYFNGRFAAFYEQTRRKIEDYYVSNRKSIIEQAQTLALQHRFEEALAMLSEYPSNINGYESIQTTVRKIYREYQTVNCSRLINEARAKFAVNDYYAASILLSDLDGESPCSVEAKQLSEQIRAQINNEKKEQQKMELERERIQADLDKTRMKAVSHIVTAYYQSRPKIKYNALIVRHYW